MDNPLDESQVHFDDFHDEQRDAFVDEMLDLEQHHREHFPTLAQKVDDFLFKTTSGGASREPTARDYGKLGLSIAGAMATGLGIHYATKSKRTPVSEYTESDQYYIDQANLNTYNLNAQNDFYGQGYKSDDFHVGVIKSPHKQKRMLWAASLGVGLLAAMANKQPSNPGRSESELAAWNRNIERENAEKEKFTKFYKYITPRKNTPSEEVPRRIDNQPYNPPKKENPDDFIYIPGKHGNTKEFAERLRNKEKTTRTFQTIAERVAETGRSLRTIIPGARNAEDARTKYVYDSRNNPRSYGHFSPKYPYGVKKRKFIRHRSKKGSYTYRGRYPNRKYSYTPRSRKKTRGAFMYKSFAKRKK